MIIAKKNKKWVRRLVGIYIGLLLVSSLISDKGLIASYKLWKNGKDLDQEIGKLQNDVQSLQDQVQKFRNDDRTIEQYAREKLNMAGENEIQYIFR